MANLDFQGRKDLINYLAKDYSDLPEVIKIIEFEVTEAFEQILTECVASALSFKNRSQRDDNDYRTAISREALTTAVMFRYWMLNHLKRVLGNKLKGYS
jgi:cation transport regulator ChaB